jgi:hypothetical protein
MLYLARWQKFVPSSRELCRDSNSFLPSAPRGLVLADGHTLQEERKREMGSLVLAAEWQVEAGVRVHIRINMAER